MILHSATLTIPAILTSLIAQVVQTQTQQQVSYTAQETFFNLASIIIGTAAAVLIPLYIKHFNKMKSEVNAKMDEVNKKTENIENVQVIQEDVDSLHGRIDKLVDNLNYVQKEKEQYQKEREQFREERDKARITLEQTSREFNATSEKQKADIEAERKLVAALQKTLDKNEERTAELETNVAKLMEVNKLADLMIDKMESSFRTILLPEVIAIITAIHDGKRFTPNPKQLEEGTRENAK